MVDGEWFEMWYPEVSLDRAIVRVSVEMVEWRVGSGLELKYLPRISERASGQVAAFWEAKGLGLYSGRGINQVKHCIRN